MMASKRIASQLISKVLLPRRFLRRRSYISYSYPLNGSIVPMSFVFHCAQAHTQTKKYRRFSTKPVYEVLENARKGDVDSIAEMGKWQLDQLSITQCGTCFSEAKRWLTLATELGQPDSPFLLGVMLIEHPAGDEHPVPAADHHTEDSPAARRLAVLKEIADATQTARTARKMKIRSQKKKAATDDGKPEIIISNHDLGLEYLRTACRLNNGRALCYLGNILLAKDTTDDVREAMMLYEKASKLPVPQSDALFNLGVLHYDGREGVAEKNLSLSFDYYKRAADLGDLSSQFWVGYSYATGDNGAIDEVKNMSINPELALKYLTDSAEKDHGLASFILATLHRSGLEATDSSGNIIDSYPYNMKPSKELFFKYLYKSVEQEDSTGLHCLGDLYLNLTPDDDGGHYLSKDEKKGIELLEKASALGCSDATFSLGTLNYHGYFGLKKDARRAFELYNVAAEQGSSEAWRNIAAMYHIGDGVPKSEDTAAEIMRVMFKRQE